MMLAVASTARAVASLPLNAFDAPGKAVADVAKKIVQEELQKRMKDGVFFGLTGTQKPSSDVSYRGAKPLGVERNGTSVGAVALYFQVSARVKLDAGGGPFTTKVAAVDTSQMVRITLVPQVNDGAFVLDASVDIIQVTATKERQAKQQDANDFANKMKAAILDRLNAEIPHHDLVPEAAKKFNKISSLNVSDSEITVSIGDAGNGYATDSASPAAKTPPTLK
jgi:hypothetical protein